MRHPKTGIHLNYNFGKVVVIVRKTEVYTFPKTRLKFEIILRKTGKFLRNWNKIRMKLWKNFVIMKAFYKTFDRMLCEEKISGVENASQKSDILEHKSQARPPQPLLCLRYGS